jgi:hypothetical protein
VNNIGLTLTADNRALIKALQDAEKAMAGMGRDMAGALANVEAQARNTSGALAGIGGANVSRGMQQSIRDVQQLGMSAKATTAALRNVPAQFTDIVVSLQGGQAPLTVLLQQGGQLKDMFGGIGPAARALGGYVASLISPLSLAATAVGVLAVGYKLGSDEADKFRAALLLTGNAAGTTTDQLAGMAAAMDNTAGVTTGKAAAALTAMTATGRVARGSLMDFAQTAIDVEKSFGQSIDTTAKNFAELGKDPVGASKRLNESLNYLTAATYAQIKAAVDLGETEKAAAIAQDAYAKAMNNRASVVTENLGYIERAYRASVGWAKEAWDAILGVGRRDSAAQRLADAQNQLEENLRKQRERGSDSMFAPILRRDEKTLRGIIEGLQEVDRIARVAGDREAERVAAEQAGIVAIDKAAKDAEANKRKAEQAASEARRRATREAEEAARAAQAAREAELKIGELRNKAAQESAEREAKNHADMLKLHEASLKPFNESLAAQQKRVASLKDEEAAIAIADSMNVSLAQAVEMVNIAKLKERQIDAMGNEDAVAAIQKEIEEREKLVQLIGSKESRDASAKAAKKAADDWEKSSNKIRESITDALMRGFESGKSAAENLRDTVKNMFNTMVLRPIIQAVVGAAFGGAGASATAGDLGALLGGGGGGSGGLGVISTIKDVYATVTGGFALLGDKVAFAAQEIGAWLVQNTTGALNSVGATLMNASGALGSLASLGGGVLAGIGLGNAISGQFAVAGNKNVATIGGTAVGAILGGPIGAAIGGAIGGLVNRAFGMGAIKATGEGLVGQFSTTGADLQTFQDWHQKGGWFRNDKSGRNYGAISGELNQFLDGALVAVTESTKAFAKSMGLNADVLDGYNKAINISLSGLDDEGRQKAIGNALAGFGEDLAQRLLGSFGKVADIWLAGPYVRAGETASQALQRLGTSLAGVNAVLDTMNQTLLPLTIQGADAASALVDLLGGLQGFQQATSAYYQAFYTEAERNAKVAETLKAAFKGMGETMPDTLAGFRALVEAQDLNTAAGRNTYAALMQLAPAFAQVTNAAGGLVATLGQVVGQIVDNTIVAIDRQITASQNAAQAARDAAQAYRDAGIELRDAARAVLGQVGSAAQNTRRDYLQGLASAKSGDLAAMAALPGLAEAMLSEQRNMARTRVEANAAAAAAAADLMDVAKLAEATEAQKSYQANLYDVNTAALQVLRDQLATGNVTVDAINQQKAVLELIGQKITDSATLTTTAIRDSSGRVVTGLQDPNGRIVATFDDGQAKVVDVTDLVAEATRGSESLLNAMLTKLGASSSESSAITGAISNGNATVVAQLQVLEAAIRQQSAIAAEEAKKRAQLAAAQSQLQALTTDQTALLNQAGGIANQAASLAQKYSISLTNKDTGAAMSWQEAFMIDPRTGTALANARYTGSTSNVAAFNPGFTDLRSQFRALDPRIEQIYKDIEAQRAAIVALGGVPAFARGGMHIGGLRLVGENGPELEATGPARIYNARQTAAMLGSGGDTADEVRALREEIAGLRIEARATAINTGRQADLMKRVTRNGEAMTVQTDATPLEVTTA